jgi:hypothetical protein
VSPKHKSKVAAPAKRDEIATLAEVRRGGGTFLRVVFTNNRRVMASVTDRGSTLRLHESFADAPDRVLHAVARLFSAKTAAARETARKVVREFLSGRETAPTQRLPREVLPGDEPHLERLRTEFDRVNRERFGGLLPQIPLHLSGRMRTRNGHYSRRPPEIVISRRLLEDAQPGEAEQTLRHEMIHLWQHVVHAKLDHGPAFRWWARLLDVHPRSRRAVKWKEL